MQVKKFVGAALLAAGLLSAGCGGTEMEPEELSSVEPSELTSREDEATVWCTNKAWKVNFYAEPELINVIGYYQCQCYQPQIRSGATSNYTKLIYERYCSLE